MYAIFIYSMREKGDWNGKGYYHLATLGERSGKPDQSVPHTGERSEPNTVMLKQAFSIV